MLWLRLHPYTAAALAAGFVLLLGGAVVVERTSVKPADSAVPTTAWATGGTRYFGAPIPPTNTDQPTITNSAATDPVSTKLTSPIITDTPPLTAPTSIDDPTDLDSLLASLTQPSHSSPAISPISREAYEFLPSGLISVSNLEVTSPSLNDTAAQRALREYGNALGSAILNFESQHQDQPTILKDHAEAPYDETKVRALDTLGKDYVALGDSMAEVSDIPTSAASAHKKLVASYRTLGAKLSLVSKSPGTLIEAIEAYNASADQFAKDFVALAQLFPAQGVRFMQGEPGSVFQFSGNGGF